MLAAAAALTMSALLPTGWWQVWRHYRRQPWVVGMAIGSLGWYVIIVIRFVTADGSELAGRAATLVLHTRQLDNRHCRRPPDSRRIFRWRASVVAAAALVVALTLLFDGLVNGWPPYWERLPGPHRFAGFERSVGAQEIATGRSALGALGPGNRSATDLGNYPVLGSYGDQNPLRDSRTCTRHPSTPGQSALRAQAQAVRYVLVDWRLARSLPADGKYFPVDPDAGKYTHPLSVRDLAKFSHIPGVARVYDGGNIVIYDLGGAEHAPWAGRPSPYGRGGGGLQWLGRAGRACRRNDHPRPRAGGLPWLRLGRGNPQPQRGGPGAGRRTAGLSLGLLVLGGVAISMARIPLHRAAWAGLLESATLRGRHTAA